MSDSKEKFCVDVEKIISSKNPALLKRIPKFIINYLKKTVHQDEINAILTKYADSTGVEFATNVLSELNIKFNVHNIDRVKDSGRYFFVSNHPLGGLDGMVIISIIGKIFPDVKFVVNDLLMNLKPLKPIFLPVNKLGRMSGEYAKMINHSYESNSQILYFPAGLCSRLIKGKIIDLDWKKNFLKQAVKYDRDIVPIYFSGRNSMFFYRLAKLRKALNIKFNIEMLYLADELFKQKNTTFDVYFGEPIPIEEIKNNKGLGDWVTRIRDQVYSLNKK